MQNLTDKFFTVLNSLSYLKVDYVLVGEFALVLHGALKFTQYLEFIVKNDELNLEKLRKALSLVFADESIKEITGIELNNYAVIRYGTPDDFFIDIIANIGEKFSYEDLKFEEVEFNGIKVRIASPETLYKMKERTFRAVDQDDLLFLKDKIKRNHDKKV